MPTRPTWFADRTISEPLELTSRESTGHITESKARLAEKYSNRESTDVLLASNMISVGVDIGRLGLMVVAGQPKTTSEYIQATSRVGRERDRPGLVVTCFNMARPRDRSHYEHFVAYHKSFYRFVEAQSVTPFASRALERGLTGALISAARLKVMGLTRPEDASRISELRPQVDELVANFVNRASRQPERRNSNRSKRTSNPVVGTESSRHLGSASPLSARASQRSAPTRPSTSRRAARPSFTSP